MLLGFQRAILSAEGEVVDQRSADGQVLGPIGIVVALEAVRAVLQRRSRLTQQELETAGVAVIPIEGIVVRMLAHEVLGIDGATEELETIIGRVTDLNVIDDGAAANPTKGQAVNLVVRRDLRPDVFDAHVARDAARVAVPIAAVLSANPRSPRACAS